MRQAILALSLLVFGLCQTGAMAFCPTSYPNEIFCDDFETYCAGGGYPVPEQPRCTVTDKAGGVPWVQKVWYQSSWGTTMILEDNAIGIIDGVTSGRYFGRIELGQQTVRDWVLSDPNVEPQVLDIHRFIGNVFGSQYAAVKGTDNAPLEMEFLTAANVGKLHYSSGYIELALGDHADNLNRANTDYAKWPKSYCCGNPSLLKGPWPVLCAQGNADPAIDPTAGCPSVETDPPPVHNAIAVGAMSMLDADPCHCSLGPTEARPKNDHLAFFDGQLWWKLKTNSPVASTGSVAPMNGSPMPPPSDIVGGDFVLSSRGTLTEKSYNMIKLTIKETTIKIELVAHVKSDMNSSFYIVTSTMDNIPRQYTGPFDRIRSGVGPGCELIPGMGWDTCNSLDGRIFLSNPDGWFVDFDNFVLHGGEGYEAEGACCNAADGACSMTLSGDCTGHWTQSFQTCEETLCCPLIYGDTNGDGSVDMTDFAMLQTCITTGGGTMDPVCACFDLGDDDAIGSAEVMNFVDCAKGPSVPGDSSGSCTGLGW